MSRQVTTPQLADILEVSQRRARSIARTCAKGGTWNGAKLGVVPSQGRGGRNGSQYLVDVDTIPPELIKSATLSAQLVAHAKKPDNRPFKITPQSEWWSSLVLPITLIKKGSHERGRIQREILLKTVYPPGLGFKKQGQPISERTLKRWVKKVEENGAAGAARKTRIDANVERVILSRELDKKLFAIGRSKEEIQKIAEEIHLENASKWASKKYTTPLLARKSLAFVIREVRKAGLDCPIEELRKLCLLPPRFVNKTRRASGVYLYHQDAGRSADVQLQRIQTHRDDLHPLDWLIADVHPIDIYFEREDGTLVTPRAIAWVDAATGRAWIDLVLCPKGKSIRREHVAESFARLAGDKSWGAPLHLYIDNGSEFKWLSMVEDMGLLNQRLKREGGHQITARDSAIVKSTPHCPQGKAIVEGLFGNLETGPLRLIEGHRGPNPMKTRRENAGRKIPVFPGTWEEFKTAFSLALDVYHNTPQRGHLNGKTPNEKFQEFIEAGWKSTPLERKDLELAFADEESRLVNSGGRVIVGPLKYRHDDLSILSGLHKADRTIFIRRPIFGYKTPWFLNPSTDKWDRLDLDEPFAFGDPAGAIEQSRRNKELRKRLNDQKRGLKKIDHPQQMRDYNALFPPPPQAESNTPITVESPDYGAKSVLGDQTQQEETLPRRDQQDRRELDLFEKAGRRREDDVDELF